MAFSIKKRKKKKLRSPVQVETHPERFSFAQAFTTGNAPVESKDRLLTRVGTSARHLVTNPRRSNRALNDRLGRLGEVLAGTRADLPLSDLRKIATTAVKQGFTDREVGILMASVVGDVVPSPAGGESALRQAILNETGSIKQKVQASVGMAPLAETIAGKKPGLATSLKSGLKGGLKRSIKSPAGTLLALDLALRGITSLRNRGREQRTLQRAMTDAELIRTLTETANHPGISAMEMADFAGLAETSSGAAEILTRFLPQRKPTSREQIVPLGEYWLDK